MFSRTAPQAESEEAKDVFAPVADLMVGVVFIFIVLMLALVMNLRNEDTVARSRYDARVAEVRSLEGRLSAEILRVRALEAEKAQLAQRLADEVQRREAADARVRALEEANARLIAFVRFVQENNLVRLVQRLAEAGQTRAEVLEQIRSILAQSNIQVRVNDSAGTLMLPPIASFVQGKAVSTFDSGQPKPTEAGEQLIRALARAMAQVLPCYAYATGVDQRNCQPRDNTSRLSAVYIEGHTDVNPLTPTARLQDNWDLSAARAISAFQIIRRESEQLQTLQNRDGDALIGVSGYAESRPSNRDARDRRLPAVAENDRRIEVRVIMTTNEEFVESVLRELNGRLEQIDDLLQQR
jgi:chemotaxis protein MotB